MQNRSKISDLTKADGLQLNFSEIHKKVGWKRCRSSFRSISDPLTRWLRKGALKQEFLGIKVTTSFSVNNFENRKAMKLVFFFKMDKILWRFFKCNNILRIFFCSWRELRLILWGNFLWILTRKHIISRQLVKKQF